MLKTTVAALMATALIVPIALQAQVPSQDEQIAGAALSLPEDMRDGAKVIGWTGDGDNVVLREGTNAMVCLAYRGTGNFSTACYHESLDPYMARGRDLTREGITGSANRERRWEEMDAGTIAGPERAAQLYILTADGLDSSGAAINRYVRTVIYYPHATQATTGIPETPQNGGLPWLMFPGTAGAHVMITPPTGN